MAVRADGKQAFVGAIVSIGVTVVLVVAKVT